MLTDTDKKVDPKAATVDDLSDAYYTASLSAAIHRLRISKYTNFIQEKYGEMAVILIEELTDNGRLTMESVVNQSAEYTKQRTGNFSDDLNRQFEDVFTQLVVDHFIMKAPNPKPLIPGQEDAENNAKEAKSTKTTKLSRQQQQQLHDPFALPSSLMKKTSSKKDAESNIVSNRAVSITPSEDIPAPPKKGAKKTAAKATKPAAKSKETTSKTSGKKRKKQTDDDEESLPDVLLVSESAPVDIPDDIDRQPFKRNRTSADVYTVVDSEEQNQMLVSEEKRILWRVNYDQFLIEFKLMACFEFVQTKLDQKAALIFNSMVNLCKKSIKLNQEHNTTSIFSEDILKEYNNTVELSDQIDKRQLDNYLPLMQATRPSIITKMQAQSRSSMADSGVYQVNIANISAVLKQKMVESIIKQQYGDGGLRVFKLLLIKKQLEPKQIADFAMIPLKDSKTLLFKMMEKSIIKLQEVPRSSDHFAARTFYLFFVDYPNVASNFVEDIYKAIYNCRERLNAETLPHLDMVQKMETIPEDQLSLDQTNLLKKVQRMTEVLETMVSNLDNDLLILSCF
uniref:DNA-directed RNA polymerase III subunit RPC3 n=1 Tax=Acytostelium leptosomum TaxID=133408 RepID=A0A1L2FUQ1_9MYCE|nr:RNA polymerase III subunit [Acytostelium leptosomum]